MRNRTELGKHGFLITSLIILVMAMYIRISWICIWYSSTLDTPEKKKDFYLSLFPTFLKNSATLVFITLGLSLIALILSALSIRRVRKNMKWLAFSIIGFSVVIGVVSIFQLM
jgi:ABC-type uncharacterized transport system YnjBCD permease subunit